MDRPSPPRTPRFSAIAPAIRRAVAATAAAAALATAAHAAAMPQKPLVIFFGGYSSTAADMQAWLAAARASVPYGADFEFAAIPYPSPSPVEADAVAAAAPTILTTVKQILATPARTFIVVGHSSAASEAATVVAEVPNRRNVRLIILDDGVDDGFTPPRGFNPTTQVECWSVVNGPLPSFNRAATMAFCRNYHELQASQCRTDVCLHFAIVNLNAAADLTYDTAFAVGGNGGTGGYANLKINLSWLNSSIGF